MSRYVRIKSLSGYSTVGYYYWFDSQENRVLSFKDKSIHFDPNVDHYNVATLNVDHYSSGNVIGSRQYGDVRYNFTTTNRCNQSATLRKIMQAYAKLKNNASQGQTVNQETTSALGALAGAMVRAAHAPATKKFAIIRLSTSTIVARNLSFFAAKDEIERRIKETGGSYLLVEIVATAKATSCVSWD